MPFDPNAAASNDSGVFGLPFTKEESALVLLPVPWEATTSYGGGTANGPRAIEKASKQIDLFDLELGNFFNAGIYMLPESEEVRKWNDMAKEAASLVIELHDEALPDVINALATVNILSQQLNNYVYQQTNTLLHEGKLVGLLGGDHSSPFGAIRAFLERYPAMGILHIDAHADLRDAYEGFNYSHASIMHNVITRTSLNTLVQVGIRDFCETEFDFINAHADRIKTFYDIHLANAKLNGKHWSQLCDDIISHLPQEVYISFDIDGLDPRYCPHTGTPVPGGLDFHDVLFLFKKVIESGRKIIGFDLNEVSPGETYAGEAEDTAAEWDANVGARLLYKLCGLTLTSR